MQPTCLRKLGSQPSITSLPLQSSTLANRRYGTHGTEEGHG